VAERRFLNGLFSPRARAWRTVERYQRAYEQHERRHPNLEPHQLLGHLWHAARKTRRRAKTAALQKPAFVATYLYACLPPPDGARALALWILCETKPAVAKEYPCFMEEYQDLMTPVFEARQKGRLHASYAKYNPQLAAEMEIGM